MSKYLPCGELGFHTEETKKMSYFVRLLSWSGLLHPLMETGDIFAKQQIDERTCRARKRELMLEAPLPSLAQSLRIYVSIAKVLLAARFGLLLNAVSRLLCSFRRPHVLLTHTTSACRPIFRCPRFRTEAHYPAPFSRPACRGRRRERGRTTAQSTKTSTKTPYSRVFTLSASSLLAKSGRASLGGN